MSTLRVTVTELPDERDAFAEAWKRLVAHVAAERPSWVVLPEMPFDAWMAFTPKFDPGRWAMAVERHAEAPRKLLPDLGNVRVFYTQPVDEGGRRFNEACVYENGRVRAVHRKAYLPDEEPVFEASWYHRGQGFEPAPIEGVSTGALVCTELWFFQEARRYGRAGVDVLWSPRKTDASTIHKWLIAGRASAMSAGAYSFSSNSTSVGLGGHGFGGLGWIIDPDGNVIDSTDASRPFVTATVDLERARTAKNTYPRNVAD